MQGVRLAGTWSICGVIAIFLTCLPTSTQGAVGVTRGAPSVSPTGTAAYEIPLTLPPGTNGLTPRLSLRYAHTQGGGLFGVGWSLTGLSAIVRCNKTYAQDGAPSPATLAVSDGYCLDGNRLRLTGGTYGNAGSTYQTEIETFSRVLAQGTAGNGPASWEVRGKDGLIYEYGNSPDSRIESVGSSTARLWALNKVRDRANNYIEIIYTEDATNGSFRPFKIRYTGNSTQGTTPPTEVQFFYETLPVNEVDSEYFAGGLIKRVTRADKIEVLYNGTTLVHRWDLTYEGSLSSTSKSRLASITECAGTVPDCLPATTFSYQNGSSGFGSEINTGHTAPATPAWWIDVNGDGRRDAVYSSSTGAGTWMVMFANSSGGFSSPINTGHPNTNYAGATPIDYNADGLEDILVPYTGGTWWVLLGTTSGLAAHSNTSAPVTATGSGANARAIDMDGDGYQDLVWADLVGYAGGDAVRYRLRVPGQAFSSTVYTAVGPLPADQKFTAVFGHTSLGSIHRIPDFNGDGRGDIVWQQVIRIWNEVTWQFIYNGGVLCTGAWSMGFPIGSANAAVHFGDFNGDRQDDLLYYTTTGTTFKVRFSRGTSFGSDILTGTAYAVAVHDWEGDGYDDILAAPPGSFLHLIRSTGEGFVNLGSTGLPITGTAIADANGDGLADLAYASSGTWRYRPHAGTYPDLLQTATDAFGIATTFNYLPLTDSSVYTKGSGATFPSQEYQGGTWVARTQTSSNGIGGTYALTHSYESARLHLQGRGSLGFGKHTVIDSRNNLRTEETFLQNPAEYQAIGAPSLVQVKQPSTNRIVEVANTWNKVTYSSGVTERRFPFISQRIVKRWEAEGAYNGALLSTTTTNNTIDSTSGTIYDSTTTTVEEPTANGVQPNGSYVTRVYHPLVYVLNDTSSNWCIGRPGRTEVTNSHNQYGGTAITRTTSRTWDSIPCRVTQEITEPDSTQWKVTRDLLYDGWGNVSSDAITGISMAVRTTTANWAPNNGRFPQSITNALSQTTQFGWDATIGTLTSMTDPNGLLTEWQYDKFGRRTREDRPDDTATTYDILQCTSGCDSRVRLYVQERPRDTSNNVVRTDIQYFDQLDRPLYEYRQMLSGSYSITTRAYDSLGRVINEYFPFWSGTSTPPYATLTYDLLGRLKQLSRPTSDSDPTAAITNIYFEGLTTRSVDALGKQTTKITNVAGGLVKSIDHDTYAQLFDLDGFGNVVRVTDSLSNMLQSVAYNVQGVKTAQTDMDLGSWTYLPNALGELINVRDAKTTAPAWTTVIGYDPLGRMTSRQDVPEGVTSTWTWGAAIHNDSTHKYIGGLKSVSFSSGAYSETYTNDDKGRRVTTQIISDATYNIDYEYSTVGQLDSLTYPTSTSGYRLKLKHEYQYGHLARVSDYAIPANGFWVANATDPSGAVIDENLGNGLRTVRGIDLVTGLIDSITTGPGGSGTIQNLSYSWDKVGNLTQRQDLRQSLIETFYYDNLHRLTSSTAPDPITLTYDAMGNIQTKTGIAGTYTYHATKKHAVTAAGSFTFAYDANGNVSTRNGSTISWYSYNLPNTISASGSNSSQFFYAPDRARWKQVASYGGTTETTTYVGGLIEKVTLGAVTSWKHYIAGGSGIVAMYTRKSTGVDETHYLTRDHLGSVDAVTDGSGGVEVRLSYDAFGRRRNEDTWSGNPTEGPGGDWEKITETTRRGFTFHEMLDNLNLTHMNGRVYDQIVGRFISADPFIPEPGLTQSFNRYSYVLNSPLTFTDPSGFCLDYAACHWMDGSLTVGGRGAEPRPSPNWYYQLNYRNVDVLPANTRPFPEDSDDQQPPPPKEYEQRVVVTITSCESDFLKCQTSPVTTAAISAPHPYLLATGALALTAAVGTAITGIRPPWSFFERPYAMNGDKPELVPRVEGSSESSPADPNQHDPKKGRKGEATIQFGAVDNQISHTFRHIDDLGLQRSAVQDAIRRDMAGRSLRVGETYSGSVEVGGIRLQYNAHQLTEEIINVGRITPP